MGSEMRTDHLEGEVNDACFTANMQARKLLIVIIMILTFILISSIAIYGVKTCL